MSDRDRHDDGPKRFARNWLMFNEARPTRPRLLRNFIVAITICLLITGLLAAITAATR